MNVGVSFEGRAQVEAFQQRHRIGLLTLLFTDIEGSTGLKQALGDHGAVALIQRHHAEVRQLLGQFDQGEEVSTAGDSFFIIFAKPSEAVRFALLLQARLRGLDSEMPRPLTDRIGIHVGEVFIEDSEAAGKGRDFYGIQVDTCARVMSLGRGGQILMTRFAFDNARQVLKGQDIPGLRALTWLSHGLYTLKGVDEPLEICEVGEAGQSPLTAPTTSDKAKRSAGADEDAVLGWRPGLEQAVPGTKWILQEKLGEGGFGEVWLGFHETLREHRVFKFCFRADRVRALKREVTLFRLLKERAGSHPHIVAIQDVCFDEPPYCVMMDYAKGKDLKTWCHDQGGVAGVPFETRLEIVAQAAEALQAAHEAGIIHRDIKPGNVLVRGHIAAREPVHVLLTDFGIGQVISDEYLAGVTRAGFTQTMLASAGSASSGTHLFMAPELLAGERATVRSDIYSLGVVLFQLLVGDLARPVTTDWSQDLSDPLLKEDLARCFAGRPEERFSSAAELARNLRRLPERHHQLRKQQMEIAAASAPRIAPASAAPPLSL